MKYLHISLILVCLGVAGCYSPPFERPKMVPMRGTSPEDVIARYRERMPDEYEAEETLIFQVFWKKIAALGYTRVDREEQRFEALCLNHLGVPLFRVTGSRFGDRFRSRVAKFENFPRFAESVGADIRRVSFGLVPSDEAEAIVRKDRILFREERKDGILEYVFGGEDGYLVEKRFLADGWLWRSLRWKVNFYEYVEADGYVYPRGVVLYNRANRYRLTVKRRDITFDLDSETME